MTPRWMTTGCSKLPSSVLYLRSETLRKQEVQLDGRHRLVASEQVRELDVELRPVERGLADGFFEVDVHLNQRVAKRRFGSCPHLGIRRVLLGSGGVPEGESIPMVGDAERSIARVDHPHDGGELLTDLVGAAEDVRVVQRHGADPRKAPDDPRTLVSVHRPELGDPDRQLTVAVLPQAEDLHVVRAVHRPEHHLLARRRHRREHVLVVVLPVAGTLVERPLRKLRRDDVAVPGTPLELSDPRLELASNRPRRLRTPPR